MNTKLNKAKINKNDEFYTTEDSIIDALKYIKPYFKDKIIYLNCDDYRFSYFYIHLKKRFAELGLKCLITTNYDIGDGTFLCMYNGEEEYIKELDGDGSFDSEECIEILKETDIVFTNPPFSLKLKFLNLLHEYNKDYCFICPINSFINQFIKEPDLLTDMKIITETSTFTNGKGPRTYWFNTFVNSYSKKNKIKAGKYEINDYDGYRIYNRVSDIDINYNDFMYVPTTIVESDIRNNYNYYTINNKVTVGGKNKYWRYLIQRK